MTAVQVIFHVSELDRWPVALSNIQNLLRAVSQPAPNIHLLANSGAVALLNQESGHDYLQRLQVMSGLGVQILVCANSLKGQGIDPERVPTWMTIVPVGVLTLIERQSQGFAYIKP